jgi:site-specific DNA-methyltransferase (adenine-specific)
MVDVTLHLGDCLDVMRGMEAGSVDAVITDPPYSSGGMVRGDRSAKTSNKYQHSDTVLKKPEFSGDTRDQRGWAYWCALWLSEARRLVRPSGIVVMFTDWRQLPTATDAIQAGGWVWRGIAVWDKGNAIPQPNSFRAQCEFLVWGTNGQREVDYSGGTYPPGLFSVKPPGTNERLHITEKPVDLMEMILQITKPGDTILDPFMGSGTMGVACAKTGRNFIGCETVETYYAIAQRRIAAAQAQPSLWEAAK